MSGSNNQQNFNYNQGWGSSLGQQNPVPGAQGFQATQNFPALGGQGQIPQQFAQPSQQQYYPPQQGFNPMMQQQQFGGFPQQQQFVQAPIAGTWSGAPQQTLPQSNSWGGFVPQGNTSAFNMAGLQTALSSDSAIISTPSAGSSSAFSTGSSAFIPKKKQVSTGGDFPTLGSDGVQKKTDVKKEPEDPCYGKLKEFFIYEIDPIRNVSICLPEQLTFIAIHYPEHYTSPIDILIWLYDMAYYKEEVEEQKRREKLVKAKGVAPIKRIASKVESSESEEEDTSFSYKPQQKKKPAPAPSRPVMGGKQLTEEQKEDQRKKKLEQMRIAQEKKDKKEIGNIKPVVLLEDLIEVDETRAPASLVFIGHVDAGKSTICGNIMLAMGVVDQRTVAKFKEEAKEKNRESWWLAYAMDESEQERAKGKTVEIGRANFDTEKKRMTIFDAPGHKNYVPNMIMGAALADYGALVISAKKGEFEAGFDADGQTREHVQLAKSLGIYKLIVVVNKMDEPSVKWSADRYNEIVTALRPFLMQSGYNPDTDCVFVPVSGLCGDNIVKPAEKNTCNWYKDGRSVMQILDDLPLPPRDDTAPLRIPVLDKMNDRGVIVFGKIESGTVKLGDFLKLMPSGVACTVITVYNSKEQCVKYAKPGENVKLRISLDSEDKVNKGDVLCLRDQPPVPVTELFEAEVDILELISYKPILSKGYQCILHIHTVADDATVKEIIVSHDKNDRGDIVEKHNPQFAKSYSKIICRIQTRIPISLEKHDYMPQLGRFTLRDEGKTIAVGKVLRYKPAKEVTGAAALLAKAEEAKKIAASSTTKEVKETFYDMDTGEEISKEEHIRRKKQREDAEMAGIAEDDDEDEATQTTGSSKTTGNAKASNGKTAN